MPGFVVGHFLFIRFPALKHPYRTVIEISTNISLCYPILIKDINPTSKLKTTDYEQEYRIDVGYWPNFSRGGYRWLQVP